MLLNVTIPLASTACYTYIPLYFVCELHYCVARFVCCSWYFPLVSPTGFTVCGLGHVVPLLDRSAHQLPVTGRMDTNESRPGNGAHHEEEIVIVGGGIGGLACALALHRVGLKAVVLERSSKLRADGAAIIFWTNAFRVLDVLGIAEKFRTEFTSLLEWEYLNARGKSLAKVVFAECEGGPHEMRTLDRKFLLEVIAGELPEGTIRFNSQVTGIKKSETRTGFTELELQDGSIITAKVVIGFDGINSFVASWMGLQKAQSVGQVGLRGMALFPDGHKFEDKAQLFVGKGIRAAFLPTSPTRVFWFLVWNDRSQGWRDVNQEQVKEEALQTINTSFPATSMPMIIQNTPPESITKATNRHRLNKNPRSLVVGGVTVAGDAAHPSTPNLGQGGCMALEDAVVMTQKLYPALKNPTEGPEATEHERIHQALLEFQLERHERTNFITTRSHRIGSVMQSGWTIVDIFRDWILIPRVVNKNHYLTHTLFDCGKLPGQL